MSATTIEPPAPDSITKQEARSNAYLHSRLAAKDTLTDADFNVPIIDLSPSFSPYFSPWPAILSTSSLRFLSSSSSHSRDSFSKPADCLRVYSSRSARGSFVIARERACARTHTRTHSRMGWAGRQLGSRTGRTPKCCEWRAGSAWKLTASVQGACSTNDRRCRGAPAARAC